VGDGISQLLRDQIENHMCPSVKSVAEKLFPMQQSTKNKEQSTKHEGEVLVRVNGVSKNFRRDLKKSIWYGMKDVASELLPFGKASKTGRADRAPSADSLSNYKFKIQNFHRPASGLLNFGR